MRNFLKDFFIYGIASVLAKIAAVFLMPIYTNILTQEEYGVMALITACKGIVDIVSNLNIHSGIARDYYEEGIERKELVSTGFYSILSLSLSIMLVILLTRSFWMEMVGIEAIYVIPFTIAIFTIPAGSLVSYFSILTRFKKKPVLYSVGTLISLAIQIGISVIGVAYLRMGISSIFVGMFLSELFGIGFFAFVNRAFIGFKFDNSILKRALVFSIPTLPAILAGWVDNSVGQFFINKYASASELGVYSIAISLASVFTLISVAFHNVWSPFLYENYKKETFGGEVNRLFTLFTLTLISITITLSLLSKEIVLILSNPSYIDAAIYISLLCLPMGLLILYPIFSSGISIGRQTKYIAYSYILGSITNVAILYLLFPVIGITAAPISLGVSRLIICIIMYKKSNQIINLPIPMWQIGLYTVVVGLCYVCIVAQMGIVVRLIIVLLAEFLICLYVYKTLHLNTIVERIKNNKKQ